MRERVRANARARESERTRARVMSLVHRSISYRNQESGIQPLSATQLLDTRAAEVLLDFAGRAKLVDFGCCKKDRPTGWHR